MSTWKLRSAGIGPKGRSSMTLQLDVNSELGRLSGTLAYTMATETGGNFIVDPEGGEYKQGPADYQVSGGWTGPDEAYSVFSVSGSDGEKLATLIAAVGVMTGPGNAPEKIVIKVNTASAQYGTQTQDTLVLTPFN